MFKQIAGGFSFCPLPSLPLYHGSKSRIDGNIRSDHHLARARCDFGRGFYTGQSKRQVLGLVCNQKQPFFYELSLRHGGLNHVRVDGLAWVFTVALFRMPEKFEKDHPLSKLILEQLKDADVISGKIADDRIGIALNDFFDDSITSRGLEYALTGLVLGDQYVFKTQKACESINIDSENVIPAEIKKRHMEFSIGNRDKGIQFLKEAKLKFAREGLFFTEIIEETKKNAKRDALEFPVQNAGPSF